MQWLKEKRKKKKRRMNLRVSMISHAVSNVQQFPAFSSEPAQGRASTAVSGSSSRSSFTPVEQQDSCCHNFIIKAAAQFVASHQGGVGENSNGQIRIRGEFGKGTFPLLALVPLIF